MKKPNPLTKEYIIWLNRQAIDHELTHGNTDDFFAKNWTREEKDEIRQFMTDHHLWMCDEVKQDLEEYYKKINENIKKIVDRTNN